MKKRASGLQIAFLTYSVTLLAVPIGSYLMTGSVRSPDVDPFQLRLLPFAVFMALLLCVRPLNLEMRRRLSVPIPSRHRAEVMLVAIAMMPMAWATTGARALWTWLLDPSAMGSMKVNADLEWQQAMSLQGVTLFLLAVLVAPFLEEILFRGFIFRAFETERGWLVAMIVTSLFFGFYHPFFLNAFLGSIVFVCVLRRTGSLWASIAVHAGSNLMSWWPLMGQHIFPDPSLPAGELSTWHRNLVAFAIAALVLPIYIWMSRDRPEHAATVMLEPDVSLQK